MIDILYLAWNRAEFTAASLAALGANTDWSMVRRLVIYTDGQPMREGYIARPPIPLEVLEYDHAHYGGPVAIMNHFLTEGAPAAWFAKVDNDVVLPPGWLEASLQVLRNHPEVDLLGLEAKHQVVWPGSIEQPHRPDPIREAIVTDHIGGVGLMRRGAILGRPLPVPAGRMGFSDWQVKNPDVVKAWISPALPMILLDRLPFDPWRKLSLQYEARGWQRPWKLDSDPKLWEWWTK